LGSVVLVMISFWTESGILRPAFASVTEATPTLLADREADGEVEFNLPLCCLLAFCSLSCGSGTAPAVRDDPCKAAMAIRDTLPGVAAVFRGEPQEGSIADQVIEGGFGGLYQKLSATGPGLSSVLVVFLKDPTKAATAKVGIRLLLACGGAYPGWLGNRVSTDSIEIHKALYSATQLFNYLRSLESVRADPDVWAMEQDTELNRIWLGIQTPSAKDRIRASIAQALVPADAVVIEDPPVRNGTEAFEVLEGIVHTYAPPGSLTGLFYLDLHVRYTNEFPQTRYPYPCVYALSSYLFFEFRLARWNGSDWVPVFAPICNLVDHDPRPVAPGAQETDSVPVPASRRVNSLPVWSSTRITGNYRFEGVVFLSTIPSSPFVSNPAPIGERISAPFRIIASPGAP
jgi:hypothetical protein